MKKHYLIILAASIGGHFAYGQCSPDLTPPVITCPGDVTVNSDPGACEATVNFTDPLATDNCTTTQTVTFNYTGSLQTFTVPAGVTSVTIETWGAQGQGGNGGLGGYVKGDLSVTPGQVLNIYVGGQNGYNGGGAGYAAIPKNGGGASDVRVGGTAVTDRVIVAGGGGAGGPTDVGNHQGGHGGGGTAGSNYAGGGAGQGYGGAGTAGGNIGGTGNVSCHSGGAGGGGFTSGGGASCNTCYTSTCGQDGSLGQGGNGDTWENGICYSSYGGTAGGGGGYYGGGGTSVGNCGSGAGGGGSSWSGSLTNNVLTGGVQSGDGMVMLTYEDGSITMALLTGSPNGSVFPVGTTLETYEATDGSGNTASCTFNVTVVDIEAPVLDSTSLSDYTECISANPPAPTATDLCAGTITGTPDVTMPLTTVGTTTVTWTFDDGSGNTVTETQNVTVTTIDLTTTVSNVTTITANNTAATAYQWIDCDNGNMAITGETGQSYVATADGNYAVIVEEGGCVDTSACVAIVGASTSDELLENVKIYPSPTSGAYTVELDQVYEYATVVITDLSGKEVDRYTVSNTSKFDAYYAGASGMYVINIIAGDKKWVSNFIVE